MFRFVLNLVLIIALGLAQLSNAVFIFGIKPNLVLCFVIVASIFSRDWLEKIILGLLGVIILKFYPGFNWGDILFIASASAGIVLVKYLRSQTLISILIAVLVATTIINAYNLNAAVITEIFVNIVVALLMYVTLKMAYEKK